MHRECFGSHSWSDYEYMFSKYVISGTSNPVVIAEPKKKWRVPRTGEQGLSRTISESSLPHQKFSPSWNLTDKTCIVECVWWCVGPHGWSWCCCDVVLRLSLAKVWNAWPCTAKARHANVFLAVKSMAIAARPRRVVRVWTWHQLHSMVAWKPEKSTQVLSGERSPIAFIILHGMQINVFAKYFQSFMKCTEVSRVRPKASEINTFAAKILLIIIIWSEIVW